MPQTTVYKLVFRTDSKRFPTLETKFSPNLDGSFVLMGAHINFYSHAYEFDGDAYSMPMRDLCEAH